MMTELYELEQHYDQVIEEMQGYIFDLQDSFTEILKIFLTSDSISQEIKDEMKDKVSRFIPLNLL